jgi:hypothetical protein
MRKSFYSIKKTLTKINRNNIINKFMKKIHNPTNNENKKNKENQKK